jgi:leader peptidase (prepilin peptidase) / N-methyltransferase
MLEAVVGLIFGLVIGSFLNVCIHRWPNDESVINPPRSRCPKCGEQIAWYDNIPILSYVLLRARCRHCGEGIAPRYLLVEALTGSLFFVTVLWYGPTLLSVKLCAFCAIIIGLTFSDIEERILPDELTLGGAALGIAFSLLVPLENGLAALLLPVTWPRAAVSLVESVGAAVVSAGLLWIVGFVYFRVRGREGLGLGDVKMMAMIGAFLGLDGALLTVMLGSLVGSILGLLYILLTKKDAASYELPFGSFLGVGALAVGLLRNRLLHALWSMGS